MLCSFTLWQKGAKGKVAVKKNPKLLSPPLAGFERYFQLETLARLHSKLCGFIIYLSKVYLLYLLCKADAIRIVLFFLGGGAGKGNLSAVNQTYNKGMT